MKLIRFTAFKIKETLNEWKLSKEVQELIIIVIWPAIVFAVFLKIGWEQFKGDFHDLVAEYRNFDPVEGCKEVVK